MSDLNEHPGPLPDELRGFVERHRATGEPTGPELGRALLKVHTATRPRSFRPSNLRRLVPPEVLAVAALFVLTIGGAGLGYWLRERRAADASRAIEQARTAWVKGDLDAAVSAFDGCDADECLRLAAAVKKARQQRGQLDGLGDAEAGSLLALDDELSAGSPSALTLALETREVIEKNPSLFLSAQRRALARQGVDERTINAAVAAFERGLHLVDSAPGDALASFAEVVRLVPATALARTADREIDRLVKRDEVPPAVAAFGEEAVAIYRDRVDVAALLERGKVARKERRYDEAVEALSGCLARSPSEPECVVALASTLAARGFDRNSLDDNRRARSLYERFLVVAAPDDKRRPRVREILATRSGDEPHDLPMEAATVHELYLRGEELRERSPAEARVAFSRVATEAPDSDEAVKARARLSQLDALAHDLYLRGYQLRETAPEEAAAAFERVLELAEPGSVVAEKARRRLLDLQERADPPIAFTLRMGTRRLIPWFDLARVAVADTSVADVAVRGTGWIEVTPKGPGDTTVTAWTAGNKSMSWRIRVMAGK